MEILVKINIRFKAEQLEWMANQIRRLQQPIRHPHPDAVVVEDEVLVERVVQKIIVLDLLLHLRCHHILHKSPFLILIPEIRLSKGQKLVNNWVDLYFNCNYYSIY